MAIALTNKHMNLLEENIVANFTSINPKGMPHMTPVWIILHDSLIYLSIRVDRSSYKHILGNDKVGISIIHPKGHEYVSMYGRARIRTVDEYNEYHYVVERIIRKYITDFNEATDMIAKVMADEDRVLLEIIPVHVFPKH